MRYALVGKGRTGETNLSWFEHFFEGLSTDVYRSAISDEQTNAETAFLIEHLKLNKGDHVLDVPCADGRLCLPLAKKGMKVTGVDLSQRCLKSAGEDASADPKLQLTYLKKDMRELTFEHEFDAAFCLGNSFGYFNPDDTLKFFNCISKSLKPGSGFILDTCLSAETFFTVGGTREWVEVNGTLMLMESKYISDQSRIDSHFLFISGGTTEEHDTTHYIFTAGEICRMLKQVGMEAQKLYASPEGDPFEVGCDRLLIHAAKTD